MATYTATPLDSSTPPLPMSSGVPFGTNTTTPTEMGPINPNSGNPVAPVSMYVKDGNDLAEGATTDTAVVGDVTGSVSAKLRGLSKIFNDIWDSVNHRIKVDGSGVTQPVSGTVTANQGGTWTVQPGNTANTTAWLVQDVAGTSGGSTLFHVISAATNNATSLKSSAGMLYGGSISNTNASPRYVKFYNKATAPAPATDNALILWTLQVPGNSTVPVAVPEGGVFGTGIGFAAVANMADTDNTSIGAGDLSIDLRYK